MKKSKVERIAMHKRHIEKLLDKIRYHQRKIKELENQETEYSKLLKKKEWKEKRTEILNLLGNVCSKCGSTEHLQVHHKYYLPNTLPWEYPNDAFLVLCRECHEKEHNISKKVLYI